jgi:ankyrin repeat protein
VSQLHEAIEGGDLDGIREFAERPSLINSKDGQGCTPMAWAALAGNLRALRALVTLGGGVNDDGASVILLAAQNGHVASVRFLADTGADVGLADKGRRAPVHAATEGRHAEVVRELIERGAYINAGTFDGRTPITIAAMMGEVEIVRVLVEAGVHLDVKDGHDGTALLRAVECRNVAAAEMLLDAGASPDTRLPDGRTALDLAGRQGDAMCRLIEQSDNVRGEGEERRLVGEGSGRVEFFGCAGATQARSPSGIMGQALCRWRHSAR